MWLVDAVAEYMELGAAYFTPEAADMLNDAFLGFSVIVLGFIIWFVYVLVKDPLCVIRKAQNIPAHEIKLPETRRERAYTDDTVGK